MRSTASRMARCCSSILWTVAASSWFVGGVLKAGSWVRSCGRIDIGARQNELMQAARPASSSPHSRLIRIADLSADTPTLQASHCNARANFRVAGGSDGEGSSKSNSPIQRSRPNLARRRQTCRLQSAQCCATDLRFIPWLLGCYTRHALVSQRLILEAAGEITKGQIMRLSINRKLEEARVGWILLWLLGVPIPVLLILFLLRGCT